MWYILFSGFQLLVQMLQYWDYPGHNFSVFGNGVLITIVFPLIWVIIFAFCREIASKNKAIRDLEERKTKEGTN